MKSVTINSLADETGIDRRTIKRKLIESGLYPPTGHTKSKLLEAIKPQQGGGDSNKEKLDYEKWRKAKRENDKAERSLVDRSRVAASMQRCVGPVANILESKLANEWPTAVAGMDVPQARIYGRRITDEILARFKEMENEWKI